MPVARLGGVNNSALYWPNLVTLGTIRCWRKFMLISLDPMLTSKLFLYGFCSLISVFEQGINYSFKRHYLSVYTLFETDALFVKSLHVLIVLALLRD